MGISSKRFTKHLVEQQIVFQNYRKSWPQFLYRHEPFENAIDIITSGELKSRTHSTGIIARDIAPEQIIANRDIAHDKVRLYFRPRNPTQFHIEGIRKLENYYNGKHGGFLVIFLFDAEAILTMPSTGFSCGNMQHSLSNLLDGDDGFDTLNFANIYHDSPHQDAEVTRQRCAEVLPVNPINLPKYLKYIVVRTNADLQTLTFLLEKRGLTQYLPLVRKTQGPGLFFENYTALDYVDVAPNRINFQLKHTKSIGKIKTHFSLVDLVSGNIAVSLNANLDAQKKYYWEPNVAPKNYRLLCKLEESFAHESIITLPS